MKTKSRNERVKERYLRKYEKYLKGDFSGLSLIGKKTEPSLGTAPSSTPSEDTPAVVAFFDGLCEPRNPHGVPCYGYVIYSAVRERVGDGFGLAAEPWSWQASNNVAEYQALIRALEWLLEHNYQDTTVIVKGDSQLAIRQMQGTYAVNAPRIVPLHRTAKKLAQRFKQIRFQWVPREDNKEADLLSQRAYAEYMLRRARKEADAITWDKIAKLPDGRFLVQRSTVDLTAETCSCAESKRHQTRLDVKIACRHIIAAQKLASEATSDGDVRIFNS